MMYSNAYPKVMRRFLDVLRSNVESVYVSLTLLRGNVQIYELAFLYFWRDTDKSDIPTLKHCIIISPSKLWGTSHLACQSCVGKVY